MGLMGGKQKKKPKRIRKENNTALVSPPEIRTAFAPETRMMEFSPPSVYIRRETTRPPASQSISQSVSQSVDEEKEGVKKEREDNKKERVKRKRG